MGKIETIAAAEAVRAYEDTYGATLERGRKALAIVESGGVRPLGGDIFDVSSQTNGGHYTVDLTGPNCNCKDYRIRGTRCKHIIAAQVYEPAENGLPDVIRLEVAGYSRGRQFTNKKIKRIRIDDDSWRAAKSGDYDAALRWLEASGFWLSTQTRPHTTTGRSTVIYTYRRSTPDEALPVQYGLNNRGRLFKGE